jgi:hypothetical protein
VKAATKAKAKAKAKAKGEKQIPCGNCAIQKKYRDSDLSGQNDAS